jgi:FdhD protein
MAALWEERDIIRVDGNGRYKTAGRIIREESFSLFIDGKAVRSFDCTPADLEDLAAGYAFTGGYIAGKDDIAGISRSGDSISLNRKTTAGRGSGEDRSGAVSPVPPDFAEGLFSAEAVYALWEAFNGQCSLYRATGAAHGTALTDGKQFFVLREDVGRHNALAKLIGAMILNGLSADGKALLVSSRLSSAMYTMALAIGFRFLLCHGAVSSDAVRAAEKAGVTLAGFVRPLSFNLYAGGENLNFGGEGAYHE